MKKKIKEEAQKITDLAKRLRSIEDLFVIMFMQVIIIIMLFIQQIFFIEQITTHKVIIFVYILLNVFVVICARKI